MTHINYSNILRNNSSWQKREVTVYIGDDDNDKLAVRGTESMSCKGVVAMLDSQYTCQMICHH